MAYIHKYVVVDTDDNEDSWEYDTLEEAKQAAIECGGAVIEREYEYSDSSLVWTPDGSDIWPPTKSDDDE